MYPVLQVTDETTEVDVFHAVVEHMRKQKRKAWSDDQMSCVNRTKDGLACAAACMLTDEEVLNLNGKSWEVACVEAEGVSGKEDCRPRHLRRFASLLSQLQKAHDWEDITTKPYAFYPDNTDKNLYVLNTTLHTIATSLGTTFQPLEVWE